MTHQGWLQIGLYAAIILAITRPAGVYMHKVLEGERHALSRVLGPLERAIYRACGIDPGVEQSWQAYTISLFAFSALGLAVTYAILRLQSSLPLNPQKLPGVPSALAFNTAVSFVTNTNWQAYSGETTMSYLSQMAALAWHNFTSAASGIAVAVATVRGLTRRPGVHAAGTIGNVWADIVRSTVYVLLPLSLIAGLFLVSQGVLQNLAPYRQVATLDGGTQTLAMGPVASQEAIKELGTNGGGFFNANSAHPFENPSPLTNLVELVLIFAIPAGLTCTFGRMTGNSRQGWALFAAMAILFAAGIAAAYPAESVHGGNMEGKEVRFGIAASALFANVTTDASCGAVNSMHDSFTPLGGLVPLFNIQLGEVIFGGVGSGLYGILVMAILTVFIAGLTVGRTPEYLGKKIETHEVKLAMIYALIFPLIILSLAAWAAVEPYGVASLANVGPHGLSEILYAYTSAVGNNGSAFGGLNANTDFYNLTLAFATLIGRFGMMLPVLAIAGSLSGKKVSPPGPGSFPTDGPLFALLLVGVIVIVGALTFLPALSLGPIVEHFAGASGKVFR